MKIVADNDKKITPLLLKNPISRRLAVERLEKNFPILLYIAQGIVDNELANHHH
jgi:hypothetical protein